jgi:predicted dehydrogenase
MSNAQSRRQVLQAGTALLAAGALGGSYSRAAHSRKPMRVGIIGATQRGDYGHGVDVAMAKATGVEIAALADADDAGREAARKRTNPKAVYADYREMFAKERLDLVAICPRWIDQRREMLLAAAEAGCHVYMEKPFCRTLIDSDDVIAALEKKKLKLALAHTAQYSPVLEVVLSLIKNGEIGDLLELRARGKEDQRGGGEDLWVLGSHMFGLMRSLAGDDAKDCTATVTKDGRAITKADVIDGAEGIGPLAGDQISARYGFDRAVSGYFASRRGAGGNPGRFAIQVFGSKGVIEMESGFLAKAWLLRDSSWSPGRSGKAWESITSAGVGRPELRRDGTYEGGHLAAIKNLLECVEDDGTPKCSAQDGRRIIEMISAVFESQRVHSTVHLPLTTRVNPLTLLS